jgi:arsenate reductase
MTIVYGIPNCASVKKARQWLETHGIEAQFHDFKKLGVTTDLLSHWIDAAGLDSVLNRRGTTWRKLTDEQRATAATTAGAIELMISHSSLIKRPVIEHQQQLLLGFDEIRYREVFAQ